MTDIDPKVASLLSHMADLGSHSKMVIYPDQARALLAEVAKLTEERDGLVAANDAATGVLTKHGIKGGRAAAISEAKRLLATPAATLAARDAEKKADGWEEGRAAVIEYALRHVQNEEPLEGYIDQHVVGIGGSKLTNPYRTPQQGDPK